MQVTTRRVETFFRQWTSWRGSAAGMPVSQRLARAMPRDETWTIELEPGCQLVCLEGIVWITQSGSSRDHVLERGERWTVPADGLGSVMVHALIDARVHVLA
jgi:Protein of unknown function (DUF2917)